MDEQRNKPKNLASQIAIETAASGTGILTLLAIGADVPTTIAGGAAPLAVSALARITQEVVRQRRNRAAHVLNEAAELVGGMDIFEERLYSHDERVELLGRVLEAAARTTTPKEKFRALSRVLVYGLQDDGDIGEAFILAAALADLEAHHVELLRYINEQPTPPEEFRPQYDHKPSGWEPDYLAKALPELAEIVDGLIALLIRHGLLKQLGGSTFPGATGPAKLTISRLGQRIIFLLGEESDWLARQAQDDQ